MPSKRSQSQIRSKKEGRSERAAARAARSPILTPHVFDKLSGKNPALRLGSNHPERGLELRRELVRHPKHYGGDTTHEVIKCLAAWGLELDALLWNAVKYIARAHKKGDYLQDLKKAAFYLDRRIQQIQNQATESHAK